MVYLRIHQMMYTEEEWQASDPVLGESELAFTSADDSGYCRVKIGDGEKTWSELPYCIDFETMAAAQAAVAEVNQMAQDNITAIENAVNNLETYHTDCVEAAETATAALDKIAAMEDYTEECSEYAAAAEESKTAAETAAANARTYAASASMQLLVVEATIPYEGWVLDEEAADQYVYYLDLSNDYVTSAQWPEFTLDNDSLATAKACAMAPVVAIPEYVVLRFRSATVPTADMTGVLKLWATTEEV